MSKKEVERFLIAGGDDQQLRARYDVIKEKAEFVRAAQAEGYDFSDVELDEVLRESGDSFDLIGNPAKRQIWWV